MITQTPPTEFPASLACSGSKAQGVQVSFCEAGMLPSVSLELLRVVLAPLAGDEMQSPF